MIRLSLPAYDATRPLVVSVAGHIHVAGDEPGPHSLEVDVTVRMWAGGFVGDVTVTGTMYGTADNPGMAPVTGRVVIANPDALGLTGAEGWFTLEIYQIVFVHDVLVDYTPLGAVQGWAEGHFS